MKIFYKILGVLGLFSITSASYAQYCSGGPSSTADSNIEGVVASGENATAINYIGCPGVTGIEDQTAQVMDLNVGGSYSIDVTFGTCGGNWGGAGEAWIDFNGDQVFDVSESIGTSSGTPGSAPWDAAVTFNFSVPTNAVGGVSRMRVMQRESGSNPLDPCGSYTWGSAVDFTINLILPPTPPAPVQDLVLPTCATGTDLTLAGPPPAGYEWYWQVSPTGTDQSNSGLNPWTVFANGTYYARAYDPVLDVWSEASSVFVSNFPLAAPPTGLSASANPACLSSEISVDAEPAGVGYFWQGTDANGVSDANSASVAQTITSSGTYYVAAYDSVSQCWSATEGIAMVIDNAIPFAPNYVDSVYNFCNSELNMEVTAERILSGSCVVSASASGDDDAATTASVNDFSCAQGPLTAATLDAAFTGSFCGDWYTFDFVVNGVTVAAGQCNQTGFDLTPYLPLTSVSVVSNDIDAFSDNVTINISVNLSYVGADSLLWYDSPVGGNLVEIGDTINALGTSVIPTATNGNYMFYVGSMAGACESVDRLPINVNVNSVDVVIDPIDVTCNNGNDGSIIVSDTLCGLVPFTFSVDGGAFGALPTDLTVGSHVIVVMDANGDMSGPIAITIGDALAPSDLVVSQTNVDGADITWTVNGLETAWNVEWGPAGFAPGSGIGSDVANSNSYTITGLDENTTYDVYVSANCGGNNVPGDSISGTFTTNCAAITAMGFCETFDSDSPTQSCWTVLNVNADTDTWNMDYTSNTNNGDEVAACYTDFNGGANDEWLISPNMTLTGNEVMSFFYRVQSSFEPNDFELLLSTTGNNPADFTDTLMYLASYSNTTYQDSVINLSDYTGDVYIAFHVPAGGLDGWRLYIDDVCFDVCVPASGTDGGGNVCRADELFDLNSSIVPGQTNGMWEFPDNQLLIVADSLFSVTTLPAATYDVLYIVEGGCTSDTTISSVTVFPPSSAGNDGTITVCKNAPINLFDGLSGNVDLGGTWYDPSSNPIVGSQPTASNIPGSFNFIYITSNGVCEPDTSLVEVIVDGGCDFLSIDEEFFAAVNVFPNPATNVLNIEVVYANTGLSIELIDINGRIVSTDVNSLTSSNAATISLENLEKGVYSLRLFNEETQHTYKIVKQ